MALRPDCQGADSPLSVSESLDHLCAPEPGFSETAIPPGAAHYGRNGFAGSARSLGTRRLSKSARLPLITMLVLLSRSLASPESCSGIGSSDRSWRSRSGMQVRSRLRDDGQGTAIGGAVDGEIAAVEGKHRVDAFPFGKVHGLRGVRLCFWFRKQLIRTKNEV